MKASLFISNKWYDVGMKKSVLAQGLVTLNSHKVANEAGPLLHGPRGATHQSSCLTSHAPGTMVVTYCGNAEPVETLSSDLRKFLQNAVPK